jgi:hypothetical protein
MLHEADGGTLSLKPLMVKDWCFKYARIYICRGQASKRAPFQLAESKFQSVIASGNRTTGE